MISITDLEKSIDNIYGLLKPRNTFPVFVSSTTTGTIPEGTLKISFRNSGAANGTVTSNGTSYTLEPNEIITLDPGLNRKNDVITFTATGTTFKIIYYK